MIATFIASYSNLEPLVHMSYQMFPSCKVIMLPKIKFCGCSIHMELRQFILMLFALTKSILWVIFRKEPWAWILQDYLGVMFSINMLRTLRLPSLKIITILLCTLFFYDIFFVFITPYFTKVTGNYKTSIMIYKLAIYRMENLSWLRWPLVVTQMSNYPWC